VVTTKRPAPERFWGLRTDEVRAELERLDRVRWAVGRARIVLPPLGVPLDFATHPFLLEPLRDPASEIVVMKGAQLGFSTVAILRAFHFLTEIGGTVILTFPTSGDVSDFTQERINPLIRRTPYLAARIVDVDSVRQKQFLIGDDEPLARWRALPPAFRRESFPRSTIHFTGSSSATDPVSTPADMLIHDEEDLSDPRIISQFTSRLDHSRHGSRFRLSTPRLPGAGIDRVWRTTDQRHWHIPCPGCRAEFELAFPGGPWPYANVVPDTLEEWRRSGVARYVCHRCGRELGPTDRAAGRWEPYQPTAAAHGYAVSQLAAPWVSAARVWERYETSPWKQDFWNLVVGLPWQSEALGFTREALIGRDGRGGLTVEDRELGASLGGRRSLGIDPGRVHDWQLQERTPDGRVHLIAIGTAADWPELDRVMATWRPDTVVCDGAYDPTKVREFAARWNPVGRRRVWVAWYGASARTGIRWDQATGDVTADREALLSDTADELHSQTLDWPRFDASPLYERLIAHLLASQKVPVWVKGLEAQRVLDHYEWHGVGPDHQFHCAAYARLARLASRPIAPPPVALISFSRGAKRDRSS
jgi:hypothetical protein